MAAITELPRTNSLSVRERFRGATRWTPIRAGKLEKEGPEVITNLLDKGRRRIYVALGKEETYLRVAHHGTYVDYRHPLYRIRIKRTNINFGDDAKKGDIVVTPVATIASIANHLGIKKHQYDRTFMGRAYGSYGIPTYVYDGFMGQIKDIPHEFAQGLQRGLTEEIQKRRVQPK